jgi:hypothetical protein
VFASGAGLLERFEGMALGLHRARPGPSVNPQLSSRNTPVVLCAIQKHRNMRDLQKRIQRLENSSSTRTQEERSKLARLALKHLSMQELECMERLLKENPGGKIHRDLTGEERDALAASKSALALEYRGAGLHSVGNSGPALRNRP